MSVRRNDWMPGRIYEYTETVFFRGRFVPRPHRLSPLWRRFLCALLHSPFGWDRGVCLRCLTRQWPT